MRVARVVAAIGTAGALVVLPACGDGGSPGGTVGTTTTAAATATTAADAPGLEVGRQYVEALAADGGPDTEAMVALSAPGSIAEDYAVHLGALAEVQAAAGEPIDQGEVTVDDGKVFLRLEGQGGVIVDIRWADFTLDDEGRLVDFTLDDEPLDDRLLVGGATASARGVTATVVSAFELVSNDSPVVVVEIENGGRGRFRLAGADYTAPDGVTVDTGPVGDGLVVPRGATSRAVLAFPRAAFGGTVTLNGAVGESPVEIAVPLTP